MFSFLVLIVIFGLAIVEERQAESVTSSLYIFFASSDRPSDHTLLALLGMLIICSRLDFQPY